MSRTVVAVGIGNVLFLPELAELFNSLKGTSLTLKDFHAQRLLKVWRGTEDYTTRAVNEVTGRNVLHVLPLAGSADNRPKYITGYPGIGMQCLLFGDYSWNREATDRSCIVGRKNWTVVLDIGTF